MDSQWVARRPAPGLSGLVQGYTGYRYAGARPGVHLGLPGTSLTAVVSLADPVLTLQPPEPTQAAVSLQALVSGLHRRPARVHESGSGTGIGIELTPAGARSLLGRPVAELGGCVLPLDELLGPAGGELLDRLHDAAGWPERFDVLDDVLLRSRDRLAPVDEAVARAWQRLTDGPVSVSAVAAEVGYSPRHLAARFADELGISPRTAGRLARFERSRRLISRRDPPTLATVAAVCGYADQAHLAREWRDFAGAPPTGWRAGEDLLYVQAEAAPTGAG